MASRWMMVLGVLAIGLAAMLGGCKKSDEGSSEPIKIGAIFDQSGPAVNLGLPEARTAKMYVDRLNKAGGILGRQVELIIKDSKGNKDQALQLAKDLIEKDQVLAIIGPSTSGETLGIKEVCQENKTILISCAAAEQIIKPTASYVFKTPQNDSDAVRLIYKAAKELGLTKVGVLCSTDGYGKAGRAQLEKLAGEFGITVVGIEGYEEKVADLSPILTNLKSKGAQAVINWSIVPAQGIVAKTMKQIGFDVQLFQSHGYGNIKYVQQSGEAANGTIFPCGRLLVAETLADSDPQKKLLMEYKKDYEAAFKDEASTFGGHAYDALEILCAAIKKAGSTDSDKVRDAIEGLQDLSGTAGVFNFSPENHCGLTETAFVMLTVKDGKFAFYNSPSGK